MPLFRGSLSCEEALTEERPRDIFKATCMARPLYPACLHCRVPEPSVAVGEDKGPS